MKTPRLRLLRVLSAALALLATITWATKALAETSPTAATTTVYVAPAIDLLERVPMPRPTDTVVTTFTVGWGGGGT